MKLHKRLERLEEKLISEPTILYMPDGKTVTLTGPGDYLLTLTGVMADRGRATPTQAAHLDLIQKCIGSEEPGGAHMVDLIRCFQEGPVKDARESEPAP